MSAVQTRLPSLVLDSFRLQAGVAAETGSPIYAELLARVLADLEAGGRFARVCADFAGHPILDNLPLRLLGAVHGLVLGGRAPELAAFYPSAGGAFEPEGAWRALLATLDAHEPAIRARLRTQVQTNEVRRSAALLGGFLRIAHDTRLPLRLLEIGSSAGLNLLWDRYRYRLGDHRWGPAAAPLELATEWRGPPPDLDAAVRVAERCGCDLAPLDVTDPDQRLRLESFVWPEQRERIEVLRAAMASAQREPPRIDASPAGPWLESVLAHPEPGVVSVVFHSTMWWYVPEDERARIDRTVRAAGARATPEAPLAWLRLEGASSDAAELRLWQWPADTDHLLARAHYHARWIHWLGEGGGDVG